MSTFMFWLTPLTRRADLATIRQDALAASRFPVKLSMAPKE